MEVVADSHALLWYLSKNSKLTINAKQALDNSKKIVVSTIVLLELLYILQKFGQEKKFKGVLETIKLEKYLIYPIDLSLVKSLTKLPADLEMHDRLIVATAATFNAPLVTKDKQITDVYKKVVW